MSDDLERIIEDNLYLKKNLQLSRHQNQQLEQRLAEITLQHQKILSQYEGLNYKYNQIQHKLQLQHSQHDKNIATFNSQIQSLKDLIDQKQLELQQFQLKMIPNLDQDMLRVKIISEMQGPYQQMSEKKDREISRLKEKLSSAQRKNSVGQLQLQSKERQWKRQMNSLKKFYEQQNNKYIKQLKNYIGKKDRKDFDKEAVKTQRKEVQQLRYTLQMQLNNQNDLRKQITTLKIDKEQLLKQLVQINEQKALQVHFSEQNLQIRSLKAQNQKLEEQIRRKDDMIQKVEKKMKQLEKQYKKSEQEYSKMLNNSKQQHSLQKYNLKEELSKAKEELRKLSHKYQKQEDELLQLKAKIKILQNDLNLKIRQNDKLKDNLNDLQRQLKEFDALKKQKLTLSKHLKQDKDQEQIQHQIKKKNNNIQKQAIRDIQNKTFNNLNKQVNSREHQQILQLQKINNRLKVKLQIANKKIVELIKDKAGRQKQQSPQSFSRQRAFSNIQVNRLPYSDKAFLLEYRDTSFTPLIPPTIFTQPY